MGTTAATAVAAEAGGGGGGRGEADDTSRNSSGVGGGDDDETSLERLFERKEVLVPGWREQLTFRALFVSLLLGFFLSFIVMKLNLTTGIIPSLNVSAGLLGFFFVKTWSKLLDKAGSLRQPFTRQENTVIQTCVIACAGVAYSGGFGSHILAMSERVANDFEEAHAARNIKNPSLGWLIGFLFIVSFVGLFCVVPLRKSMIIGYRLTYPSGTATAYLINSFHTPQGALQAKKQVTILFRSLCGSFLWSFFQWFYTAGNDCGFAAFPTFGLKAYENSFYFDFSATYVGVGMICPYMISISLLLGSFISWGILWPYISSKKGDWYSATLSDSSMRGLFGYKVFISVAMILGDGLFHFIAVLLRSSYDMFEKRRQSDTFAPFTNHASPEPPALSFDDRRRTTAFLKEDIPTAVMAMGYFLLSILSVIVVPLMFPQLKPYHVIAAYLAAPFLAFCNSYGAGLTDWNNASSYGKLAVFIFGSWCGLSNGGVLAGLAACGVMMGIVSTASDLMQDFKTAYLTLSSPRSMFVSQAIGTAMGCIIAPSVFWIFYKAFPLGDEGSQYPAPYANVYRGIALFGVKGFSALPKHCTTFCLGFFFLALLMNGAKEVARYKGLSIHSYVPSAMGMAIPFFLGSYFTVDMCVGSLIVFLWRKANPRQADVYTPAVASGMICGDGIWSLPASLLALGNVNPPICMRFFSRAENVRVQALLSGGGSS